MRAILKVLCAPIGYGWLWGRGKPERIPEPVADPGKTVHVIPLPSPVDPGDIEGKTVRAPMSHEEAHEMHARYAPSFDQQLALNRHIEEHGDAVPEAVPEHDPPGFDQHRYATALQYADAFEAQLTQQRRTQAYQVAQPRRIARGSYTPQHYAGQRSDQPASQWDEPKTQLGVHPLKK